MKKFLIKHEKELKEDSSENGRRHTLNNKLLINWAFDIAKGMQYLARMHIMHGDLASRNILIQTGNRKYFNCNLTLVLCVLNFDNCFAMKLLPTS